LLELVGTAVPLMRHHRLPALLAFGSFLAPVLAQCPAGATLLPLGQCPAPAGSVYAMVSWDPDGPGPLGQRIVCGGEFQFAGMTATANIAAFDPAARSWSALGAGFDGPVRAIVVSPSGSLLAAGDFQQSGTTAVAHVARWNGAAWVPLGGGTNAAVLAAAVAPNGDLFVGGTFTVAGGIAASRIARWDGSAWSALGSGVSGLPPYPVPPPSAVTAVTHLGVRSNGDLIVAGAFSQAGGGTVRGLARWNGAWQPLGAGPVGFQPTALRVLANDDVVVGSDDFQQGHQAQRWNGSTWTLLGLPSPLPWHAFGELSNGALVAQRIEIFSAFGELVEWNGSAWAQRSGPALFGPAAVLLSTGGNEIWICGPAWIQGGQSVRHFDGQAWRAPADGLDGWVAGAVPFGDGFALGGFFTQVQGAQATGVAVQQNGTWSALGAPVEGYVYSLLAPRAGGLLVGGYLTVPSVPGSQDVVRWDGTHWQAMGTPPGGVQALAEGPHGELFAGGAYPAFVAQWNGASWQALGALVTTGEVIALAVLPNGDLVAGLRFEAGAKVLRWNGASWSPLGGGLPSGSPFDEVRAFAVLQNGDLVVGGNFVSGNLAHIARWDGTSWQAMGAGLPSPVVDLDLLPNGELLATHRLTDDQGQPVAAPSRWNGSTWTVVPGISASAGREIAATAVDERGEVLFAGDFEVANGVVAGGLASLRTNCPAALAPAGSGCVGSAGLVVAQIERRAWLGGTWRARATNLPAASLAVHVLGLNGVSLPLASLLPAGLPGCTLHVSPDLLQADVPVAGATTAAWGIPSSSLLLGQTFRHQVVSFELGSSLAITAATASNAWSLAIGAW
jgi:hypothetical protein